jgi:hypothetical protein
MSYLLFDVQHSLTPPLFFLPEVTYYYCATIFKDNIT